MFVQLELRKSEKERLSEVTSKIKEEFETHLDKERKAYEQEVRRLF
jgi:hypothetical protein